jgi:hypothetical protein
MLTPGERDRLAGWISLDERDARHRCGANRELLARAVAGEHLAEEVVAKLRAALTGNGAAG